MNKGTENILIFGGLGVAAYMLFFNNSATSPVASLLQSIAPGAAAAPGAPAGAIPTNVALNNGQTLQGSTVPFAANYAQLIAANPNLANPNYVMTAAENAQYIANYLDLQQGLPTWVGTTDLRKTKIKSLSQAAQEHWYLYGCSEKRVFVPMQPPSTAKYIPPPVNPKAKGGGSSWIGSALTAVAMVAVAIIGEEPQLNNAECELIFTGGAVIKDILPMYAQVDPILTSQISSKLDGLLTKYS